MAVPIAASMQAGKDNSFDRVLRDAASKEQSSPATPEKARQEDEPIDSNLTNGSQDVPAPQDVDTKEPADSQLDVREDGDREAATELEADVTESIQRGEPEQQAMSAGKGTDSPRTSQMSSEPLIAASLQQLPIAQQQFAANAQTQVQATATAKAIDPTVSGLTSSAAASSTASKMPSVQGAYSAKSAAQAQMLEQARDSVFKQILMKLNSEGGEVRMRLEPPDLGQLDLRMTVEGGNKLSLQISAERQDINHLLQRHLDELKQSLQASGLEITGAEVQTRSEFHHQQAQRDAANGEVAGDDATDSITAAPQARGYITAEGLDFWA